ncbi:MAG: fumarate hydratase class II [Verrucomicrobiales bacterium]|jgi:fumarate hydratase class II
MSTRIETDSMGEVELPDQALYGASTQRAVRNFPISGRRMPRCMIRALGLVKWAAAQANRELGEFDPEIAGPIIHAAREIADGQHDDQFVVDVFQTGSGTSTNMNANEVIANRVSQLSGQIPGSKVPAHPNDHVNRGQSSNDVFPTAIHVAAAETMTQQLLPELEALGKALRQKASAFDKVVKTGRTHLMDATPIRLGQEFGGYARQLEKSAERVRRAIEALLELPLGGTAVGTGLNRHAEFPEKAIGLLREFTGIPFVEAADHFEAQAARDGVCEASGELKTIACSLFKIANDVRWLSSGPRCGLGEIRLPATQPGSSIMPGKVNPVMSEALMQVAAQVIGNDAAVTWGAANGNFELNVMMPMMAVNLLDSISLLANATAAFRERCVEGIEANEKRCKELAERSLALATALAPEIGYDAASRLAKEASESGMTVRELAIGHSLLPPSRLAEILDPAEMTRLPGGPH